MSFSDSGGKGDTMADHKHMTIDKRRIIERGLNNGCSFKEIGRQTGKDCTTISKEVKNHRCFEKTGSFGRHFNNCEHRLSCDILGCCNNCARPKLKFCRYCPHCISVCPRYSPQPCPRLSKAPYTCNGCKERRNCTLEKAVYYADSAQKEYELVRSESREGINLTEEELKHMSGILKPLIDQGQSIYVIHREHANELMRCERTIYSYVDKGVLDGIRNIDLVRKVRFRPRKGKKETLKVDRKCRIGRTMQDFRKFRTENPYLPYTEIDSVEGIKGGAVLLTCHHVQAKFQLAFYREANDSRSVTDIFNNLYETLGDELYRKLFHVILADRGSEFSDPTAIEFNKNGERRSFVFYCDPENPGQKGHCENNHTLIRRVIPKGTDLSGYNQEKIDLLMSHINSYKRKDLGGRSPYEMMVFMYGSEVLEKLNIKQVASDNVYLKPSLLTK